MAKILNHFEVKLVDLFSAGNSTKNTTLPHSATSYGDEFGSSLFEKTLDKLFDESVDCVLQEGVYLCYVPWPRSTEHCMRSIIILRRVSGKLFFTRLVRLNQFGQPFMRHLSRKQFGLVSQWKNVISLMGSDFKREHSKTMINLVYNDLLPFGCMSGTVSTYSMAGMPICAQLFMHYQAPLNEWRHHYKTSGMLAISDPSIRSDVAFHVAKNFSTKDSLLQSVDLLSEWR
jgi:hypothetical protein